MADNIIKINYVNGSYVVSEPGFPFDGESRLKFGAAHAVPIDGGFLVVSEDYDRDHIRIGTLKEHVLNANPDFVSNENEARVKARKKAIDLADTLLRKRPGLV